MRILGLDTATRTGSVGLLDGDRVVWERSSRASPGHGRMLGRLVDEALRGAGWTVSALDAIAVSIGPGSFTGLRVGLSLAKGLAFVARIPVLPVPTLSALASVAGAEPGELVCPMLDARKGEVYGALYEVDGPRSLLPLGTPVLARPEELLARVDDRPCRVLGDAVELYGEAIAARLGPRALVLPFTHYHPRGGAVARAGAAAAALGGPALATLEPAYVRAPYVVRGGRVGSGDGPA
jgi:tRNA threonylcarbamoyladenosine biosynthesis protein TsaB